MNIKQKTTIFITSVLTSSIVGVSIPSMTAFAATCGGVQTSIISCSQTGGSNTNPQNSGLWGILLLVLNILTAGIGIAAVGGIVYGSILYASARDKAEQTKKAIEIITNVVIGIIAYGMMYLLLNFLIPGGIFT